MVFIVTLENLRIAKDSLYNEALSRYSMGTFLPLSYKTNIKKGL